MNVDLLTDHLYVHMCQEHPVNQLLTYPEVPT